MAANGPLSPELLRKIDAYWRAANYLSVGQIYLYDNPLLREPLTTKHIKPRLLKPLLQHVPALKIRVINVVDLMRLQPPREHPHGLSDREFDALFTTDKPIIFAFTANESRRIR